MTSLADKPPVKVQRMIRSLVKVISTDSENSLEFIFSNVASFILSYGGEIKGCKINTIDKTKPGDVRPSERHIMYVFYQVPINVTNEILGDIYQG